MPYCHSRLMRLVPPTATPAVLIMHDCKCEPLVCTGKQFELHSAAVGKISCVRFYKCAACDLHSAIG